jgi:formate--tetrahydrofolate ligase
MKHAENILAWGLPLVVAVNRFATDTDEEIAGIRSACEAVGIRAVVASHFADGGQGALALADAVLQIAESGGTGLRLTYTDDQPLWDKVRAVAQKVYGANDIMADAKIRQKFKQFEADGYGRLPVCLAKTQYSFSTDPLLRGRPKHFDVPLREVRLSAGAGFVVVLAGDIMTMPGLPKQPAAEIIDIDEDGNILGLS